MGEGFWFEAGALVPSIGVGLLFWFVIRSILRADRAEREADKQAEKEYLARRGEHEKRDEFPEHTTTD